jgi:hypothetical protein
MRDQFTSSLGRPPPIRAAPIQSQMPLSICRRAFASHCSWPSASSTNFGLPPPNLPSGAQGCACGAAPAQRPPPRLARSQHAPRLGVPFRSARSPPKASAAVLDVARPQRPARGRYQHVAMPLETPFCRIPAPPPPLTTLSPPSARLLHLRLHRFARFSPLGPPLSPRASVISLDGATGIILSYSPILHSPRIGSRIFLPPGAGPQPRLSCSFCLLPPAARAMPVSAPS